MNYYYDTEFIEGTQKKMFGQTKPTIDLISIGIVAEDGREYYAISKDFNLKEAWNRYDLMVNKLFPIGPEYNKSYWIRDNVLKPIFDELFQKDNYDYIIKMFYTSNQTLKDLKHNYFFENFTYKNFKRLVKKYGKSNKQIAEEVKEFCKSKPSEGDNINGITKWNDPKFYGYYSAYDHVALCWLFGKMIDLPKGFPMYCIDLKQIMDEKVENSIFSTRYKFGFVDTTTKKHTLEEKLNKVKQHPDYPKQTNEHNALADAHWNKQLHKFLNTL